jgi:hypothetical protein
MQILRKARFVYAAREGKREVGGFDFQGADYVEELMPVMSPDMEYRVALFRPPALWKGMSDGWEMSCDHDRISSCAFGSQALKGFDLE